MRHNTSLGGYPLFGKVMIAKRLLFAMLGLALLMPPWVFSQTSQLPPAKFKGIVVDAYIARIPKASVLIEGANKKWNLETDEDGKNTEEINVELPAGKYKFTVEVRGFKRLVVEDFCVASGAIIAYEFRLEVRDCDDCDGLIAPDKPPSVRPSAPPNKSLQVSRDCSALKFKDQITG